MLYGEQAAYVNFLAIPLNLNILYLWLYYVISILSVLTGRPLFIEFGLDVTDLIE